MQQTTMTRVTLTSTMKRHIAILLIPLGVDHEANQHLEAVERSRAIVTKRLPTVWLVRPSIRKVCWYVNKIHGVHIWMFDKMLVTVSWVARQETKIPPDQLPATVFVLAFIASSSCATWQPSCSIRLLSRLPMLPQTHYDHSKIISSHKSWNRKKDDQAMTYQERLWRGPITRRYFCTVEIAHPN